jgi:hypothetical protein
MCVAGGHVGSDLLVLCPSSLAGLPAESLYCKPPATSPPGLKLELSPYASAAVVEYFGRHTEAMDAYLTGKYTQCLAILDEMQKTNGEPAPLEKRNKEWHQGSATVTPHYLADDLKVYQPSGVHPTPPGTWPGPNGDVAAATLRFKAREALKEAWVRG